MSHADSIFIGVVASCGPADASGFFHELNLKVEQRIKGSFAPTATLPVMLSPSLVLPWTARQVRLLVFIDRDGHSTIVPLARGQVSEMTSGFRGINDPEALVREIRRLAPLSAEYRDLPTIAVTLPASLARRLHPLNPTGMGIVATVPVDTRLERLAVDSLKRTDGLFRDQAAKVLGYFKSPKNVELLRGLLADNAVSEISGSGEKPGHRHLIYPVRSAAYEALSRWGIPVDKPLPEKDAYVPETVTYLWYSRHVDAEESTGRPISEAALTRSLLVPGPGNGNSRQFVG